MTHNHLKKFTISGWENCELMEKLNFHYLKGDTNILLRHLFVGSTAAEKQKTTRILAVKTNPQIKERRRKRALNNYTPSTTSLAFSQEKKSARSRDAV